MHCICSLRNSYVVLVLVLVLVVVVVLVDLIAGVNIRLESWTVSIGKKQLAVECFGSLNVSLVCKWIAINLSCAFWGSLWICPYMLGFLIDDNVTSKIFISTRYDSGKNFLPPLFICLLVIDLLSLNSLLAFELNIIGLSMVLLNDKN